MADQWPRTLWIVRHGQSAGNVARDAAEAQRLARIDIAFRDMDTPLSRLGEEQACALGAWFGTLPEKEQPQVILCSPYVRAMETARLMIDKGKLKAKLRMDERLREKEFGILDRLTRYGITAQHPELAEQRSHVGKFYFRPPGGESWCDVILRLRSTVEMVTREYVGQNVLIVAHQVTVSCLRYLLEHLDEAAILGIDREGDVPNCGVTSYRAHKGEDEDSVLKLDLVNFTAPLHQGGAPVTAAPDSNAAPGA